MAHLWFKPEFWTSKLKKFLILQRSTNTYAWMSQQRKNEKHVYNTNALGILTWSYLHEKIIFIKHSYCSLLLPSCVSRFCLVAWLQYLRTICELLLTHVLYFLNKWNKNKLVSVPYHHFRGGFPILMTESTLKQM